MFEAFAEPLLELTKSANDAATYPRRPPRHAPAQAHLRRAAREGRRDLPRPGALMAAARAPPFVMHGARDAMAGGLAHIEEQVKGIEQAVVENPGLAFDLAKTLIESTCRAVLGRAIRRLRRHRRSAEAVQVRHPEPALPARDRERRGRGPQEPAADARPGSAPPFRASANCATSAVSPRTARANRAR